MKLDFTKDPRGRWGLISIVSSLVIFGIKVYSYLLTSSLALGTDAIEGLVNISAGAFAMYALKFALDPADKEHPYGHGKMENFSASFEGGLVTLAGLLIAIEAITQLIQGPRELKELSLGLAVNVFAGVLNGILGFSLQWAGRKHHSETLKASGAHILTDFWTTAVIFVGLMIVKYTGYLFLDAGLALLLSTHLLYTGVKIVRSSMHQLLDQQDPEHIEKILNTFNQLQKSPDWNHVITLHHLRTLKNGRFVHVDAHVVVPEYLTIADAHKYIDDFEFSFLKTTKMEGEFHSHLDPCYKRYCKICPAQNCNIRRVPFEKQIPLVKETAMATDEELYKIEDFQK